MFTVKEETGGRWSVHRDFKPLIKQLTAAQAINDASELARIVNGQSGEAATVAFERPKHRSWSPVIRAPSSSTHRRQAEPRSDVKQFIDLRNPLNRAFWCEKFSCNENELIGAVHHLHSADVGAVGSYLATRFSLDPETDIDVRADNIDDFDATSANAATS